MCALWKLRHTCTSKKALWEYGSHGKICQSNIFVTRNKTSIIRVAYKTKVAKIPAQKNDRNKVRSPAPKTTDGGHVWGNGTSVYA